MLDLEFTQLTDLGRVRKKNEDYLGHALPATANDARSHGWLFALADGVGGQPGGDIASRTAVETVVKGFQAAPPGELHAGLLAKLVKAANLEVYERATSPGVGAGMATTIVVCALRFDRAVVAHVGDSRCYHIRSGHAKAVTHDHTVVNDQLRLGLLSAREAAEATTRHMLSRSLGNDMFVAAEIREFQVVNGDVLLLCSDGLHGAVPEAEIGRQVDLSTDLESAARALVARANEKDGSDNVSLQIIRVRDVERVGMYRGRPYKLR
jgi:protein phosphatase